MVAGSGTEWTGSEFLCFSFSGFGGFSGLDFEECPVPFEASAAGEGISIPRIATRPNDLESFMLPSEVRNDSSAFEQKVNLLRDVAEGPFLRVALLSSRRKPRTGITHVGDYSCRRNCSAAVNPIGANIPTRDLTDRARSRRAARVARRRLSSAGSATEAYSGA